MCELAARAPAGDRPALTATIGLRSSDAPRDLAELPRISETFQVQQDHLRVRSSAQYGSRSLLDTSALLPTETKLERPSESLCAVEDRQAERAALGGDGDGSGPAEPLGENVPFRRTRPDPRSAPPCSWPDEA